MALVKICGLNDAAGFDAAVEAGADFLGFNFFPPSPRYVTAAVAAGLSNRAPGGPARVGLFVDPTDAAVAAVLDEIPLDALQLYADQARIAALRKKFDLPVWRAIAVTSREKLPAAAEGADRLLLEAQAPAGATRPGGNAVTFDWTMLAGWTAPAPWMLAGGLTPANVGAAIRTTGAPAVDVSSGVEICKGEKDPTLIRAFIAAARPVSYYTNPRGD